MKSTASKRKPKQAAPDMKNRSGMGSTGRMCRLCGSKMVDGVCTKCGGRV